MKNQPYIYYQDEFVTLYCGDVRDVLPQLPENVAQCVVTSPPYFGLRDYGTAEWQGGDAECDHLRGNESWVNGPSKCSGTKQIEKSSCGKCGAVRIDQQIGLEASPKEFVAAMVEVFDGTRRVMRKDGVTWLNLGDSYASNWPCNRRSQIGSGSLENGKRENRPPRMGENFKDKDLMLMPHRVAIALQDSGWWVRSDIPWVKRNCMPESCSDRPTKSLEYVFMLSAAEKYFCDMQAVRQKASPDTAARMQRGVSSSHKNIEGAPGQTPHSMNKPRSNVRDRSLPTNRNGITGSLDETPAGGRNFRNSDLWYSSIKEPHGIVGVDDELVGLDVNPAGFKESHFATFPTKLIEPLIKMGTSEKGECAECGKAWVRDIKPSEEYAKKLGTWTPDTDADAELRMQIGFAANGKKEACSADYVTVGWKPQCDCNADVVPQTVFEPFAGAGTTLLVAKRLGRRAIGVELNPEYCSMIVRRLKYYHKAAPPPRPDENATLGPLFDLTAAADGVE